MAHFRTRIATPRDQQAAFDYVADLRNFSRWDPGVSRSELVRGGQPGPDAAYEVVANNAELTYETREWSPPRRTVVEARTTLLRSYDVIEVEADDDGSVVTYDARLRLAGPLALLDPVLSLFFDRIARKAAEGLREALDGSTLE